LYQKGVTIRNLYPNLLSSSYKTTDVHFNSSAWERSITTTYGIISGLYSSQNNFTANIPVYSTPWENDYTLYNYDKCPKYNTALTDFFASAEFKNKVDYYSNLTNALNAIVKPTTPITLQNIYTTWNRYWLSINRPESGEVMPPISQSLYSLMTEATNYIETKKMSVGIAGTYFGSTLLNAIKYRTDMFIKGNTVFGHKMIMSTSHYPNILGLFASLGYTGAKAQSIPDYNAMVVFELWNNTSSSSSSNGTGWSLQIKYYDGDWYSVPQMYPIGLGACSDSQDCSYDYNTFWNKYNVKNLTQFCMDCESTLPMCVGSVNSNLLQSSVNNNNNVTTSLTNNNSDAEPNTVYCPVQVSNREVKSIEGIVAGSIILMFISVVISSFMCIKMIYSRNGFTMYTGSANV